MAPILKSRCYKGHIIITERVPRIVKLKLLLQGAYCILYTCTYVRIIVCMYGTQLHMYLDA